MKTIDELDKIVKDSKENTQAAYNAIGDRILHEIERLSSEGKKDEDGYIHVEDFDLDDLVNFVKYLTEK